MPEKIVIHHLYKIFGPRPEEALSLIEQGLHKDEIFSRIGHVVGVRDVSLRIEAGEVFVVMGLSGSGKSTLVRMINRLIEPTSGEILIDGEDVLSMSADELVALRRRDIAMVFQSFALLPHMTVLENAAFGLEVAGVPRSERRERAMHALEQVGLGRNADSRPDELSGGMKQRVGLARALATDPTILLMDEAFSALDPLIRREMQEELLRLQEEHARTIVFISHDLDEAMRIGDRIAMMEGGAVTQIGTPKEILDNPAADYIRDFFKDVDVSQVYAAEHATDPEILALEADEAGAAADLLRRLESEGRSYAYLLDGGARLRGVVSTESLRAADGAGAADAVLPEPVRVRAGTPLGEVLGRIARTPYPVPVVGRNGRFRGAVSRTSLLNALEKGG